MQEARGAMGSDIIVREIPDLMAAALQEE